MSGKAYTIVNRWKWLRRPVNFKEANDQVNYVMPIGYA